MVTYDYKTEISPLGTVLASAYFKSQPSREYPVDAELIASKYFGLHIEPVHQISSAGVWSGIDTTQSVLFIDYDFYMDDATQHKSRQAIAHELGHIIYDAPVIRNNAASTAEEAFDAHLAMTGNDRSLEWRAHQFAGALLVPRKDLLKQCLTLIAENLNDLQLSNPTMPIGQLISALGGFKVANHFGVSEDVIRWQLNNECFCELLQVKENAPVTELKLNHVNKLLGVEEPRIAISERVKLLIPAEARALLSLP